MMKILASVQSASPGIRFIPRSPLSKLHSRHSSTQEELRARLLARPPNYIYDNLSNTPSHLLNITLADLLPAKYLPSGFDASNLTLPIIDSQVKLRDKEMPPGHHLVYFPPQVLGKETLADGTDSLHSPGPPFNRRMWAGGSLLFNNNVSRLAHPVRLSLDSGRAVCKEQITEVTTKEAKGEEKVFVSIERRMSQWSPTISTDSVQGTDVLERRDLVFLKEKSPETVQEDATRPQKILLVPQKYDDAIRVSITPTKLHLARFSALTFNAHSIHLDPQYCREVEGYRNLLVHGPLSLILMLSVLKGVLRPREMIYRLDYRNLTPLYVDEAMGVCVKENTSYTSSNGIYGPEKTRKFDVWIEGSGGGYAVKGTALVGYHGSTFSGKQLGGAPKLTPEQQKTHQNMVERRRRYRQKRAAKRQVSKSSKSHPTVILASDLLNSHNRPDGGPTKNSVPVEGQVDSAGDLSIKSQKESEELSRTINNGSDPETPRQGREPVWVRMYRARTRGCDSNETLRAWALERLSWEYVEVRAHSITLLQSWKGYQTIGQYKRVAA